MRLQPALEARVAAGAPGALARIEAPHLGLACDGAAGQLARGESRALRPDDAIHVASVTKSVTAVVAVKLAHDGRLALDGQLGGQLTPELLHRWSTFTALPRTTPRQLLAHTAGLPNYFDDEAFLTRLRHDPDRVWHPVELVDHAATPGSPAFGHTGFIGAFAFHAPEYDAVLVGTHNASHVDRWPLVAALCQQLRDRVPVEHPDRSRRP